MAEAILLAGVLEVFAQRAEHLGRGLCIFVGVRDDLITQDFGGIRAFVLACAADTGQFGVGHDMTTGHACDC
ncbi:hypothetical protein A9R05_39865 (plasmid) [Burkholderia sp. KK1]|nr:hypothetical protein A9R05_39865 [Burkholderia sp. KK1]